MFPLILFLMAGEMFHNGFYGFAVIGFITAICSMRWLWTVIGAFWVGRALRKSGRL
jgi:hypothetical protein